jgi:hypothetical protein
MTPSHQPLSSCVMTWIMSPWRKESDVPNCCVSDHAIHSCVQVLTVVRIVVVEGTNVHAAGRRAIREAVHLVGGVTALSSRLVPEGCTEGKAAATRHRRSRQVREALEEGARRAVCSFVAVDFALGDQRSRVLWARVEGRTRARYWLRADSGMRLTPLTFAPTETDTANRTPEQADGHE